VPEETILDDTYRAFVSGKKTREAFDKIRDEHKDVEVEAPKNLGEQIEKIFEEHPDYSWHQALRSIADPDGLAADLAKQAVDNGDDDHEEPDDDPEEPNDDYPDDDDPEGGGGAGSIDDESTRSNVGGDGRGDREFDTLGGNHDKFGFDQ
jgi:hypothetical protein